MSSKDKRTDDWSPDVARVSGEIASRLHDRGIAVHDTDTPDDLELVLEAVEAFETAVEQAGGDLMVDEPPTREAAQPDDPRFLLPLRNDDESVSGYLKRLDAATRTVIG